MNDIKLHECKPYHARVSDHHCDARGGLARRVAWLMNGSGRPMHASDLLLLDQLEASPTAFFDCLLCEHNPHRITEVQAKEIRANWNQRWKRQWRQSGQPCLVCGDRPRHENAGVVYSMCSVCRNKYHRDLRRKKGNADG